MRCVYGILGRIPRSILYWRLVLYRVLCDEGKTNEVQSLGLLSTADAVLHRFPRSVVANLADSLHSGKLIPLSLLKAWSNRAGFPKSRETIFCKREAGPLPTHLKNGVEILNIFSGSAENSPGREVTFPFFLFAKIFCDRFQEQHTVRCVGWKKCVVIQMYKFREVSSFLIDEMVHGRKGEHKRHYAGMPVTGPPLQVRNVVSALQIFIYTSCETLENWLSNSRLKRICIRKYGLDMINKAPADKKLLEILLAINLWKIIYREVRARSLSLNTN